MGNDLLNIAPNLAPWRVLKLALAVVAFLSSGSPAIASDKFPLSYSGRLVQSGGAPVEGPVDIQLNFFASEIDGSPLTDPYPFSGVQLSNGVFTVGVQLSVQDLQLILGNGSSPVFAEVTAGGRPYPRQRFSFVPFALRVPVDDSSLIYDKSSGKLTINGSGTATAGQVLTSDGSGKVRWDKLGAASIDAKTASDTAPVEDQVLTYKNGKWVAANPANPILALAPATGSAGGYLSSSDWNTFNSKQAAGTYMTRLVGDVIATGPGTGTAALASVALPGTATKVSYDAKGRVLSGGSLTATDITAALGYSPLAGISITGGPGLIGGPITTSGTISLATTGVTSGTYTRATLVVDSYGRLTSASAGVLLADSDISPSAAIAKSKISGLDADLAGKEPSLPSGGTSTQFLNGTKTWQSLNTGLVTEDPANKYFTDARARSALSVSAPLSYDSLSGLVSLTQSGGTANGYLSSADWTTFNAKQNALGYAPVNKAGDSLSGSLNLGTNDLINAGNIQIANAKTLGLGVYATDPTDLTTGDKGKTWFNSATKQIKYWDGTATQIVGAVGAAVATLNGQIGANQSFAVPGTTGMAPDWSSSGNIHTLNIPLASAAGVTAGLLSNSDYGAFTAKLNGLGEGTGIAVTTGSGTATVSLKNTAVSPGAYTRANITVDAQGRLTSAENAPAILDSDISATAAIAQSKISGLGTSLAAKEGTVTSGTSTQYYRGDKTWQELTTSSVSESGTSIYYSDSRARSALTAVGPVTYSIISGAIGMNQASGSGSGYLSSSDWTIFNDKQNTLGYTPVNKAGDTLSGSLNLGANDLTNAGNIQIAAAKTLGLGVYATDPSGLTSGDKGKTWFNSVTKQIKYWDGTATQIVGAAGASVATLNGQTGASQSFAVPGTTGNSPSWSSAEDIHTLSIPLASASGVTAGLLSNADYSTFNAKQPAGNYLTALSGDITTSGFSSGSATATLPNLVTAGNATKVTYDAKGRITAGTSLVAADIPAHSAALITSDTLSVANGGTGASTLAANALVVGNGTGPLQTIAPGSSGNVLTSDGTAWTSATLPAVNWAAPGAIGSTTPSSGAFTTVTTTGNVGIGTASPSTRLHIYNTAATSALISNDTSAASKTAFLELNTAADGRGRGILMSTTDDQSWWAGVPYFGNGYSIGRHATQPEYSANSFLFINESGNVGIGTTAPAATLDVNGKLKLQVDTATYASAADSVPEVYKLTAGPTCSSTTRGSMFVGRPSATSTQDALCVCLLVDSVYAYHCFNP